MPYLNDIKGNEKPSCVRKWVSEHKVEIVIGVALTITAAYGIKCFLESNSKAVSTIDSAILTRTNTLPEVTTPIMPDIIPTTQSCLQFKRSGFVRTLPVNRHASTAKAIEAAEKGIELQPNETLVKECLVTKKLVKLL